MKFLSNTSWPEIYKEWRRAEATNDLWREHYERRGFKTWEDFRDQHIKKENLPALEWELYEITPEEIPAFHCGDFENWQKLSKTLGDNTFATLSQAPFFQDHQKIKNLLADFPAETQLIALKRSGQIHLFEGHHRAVALCQLLKTQNPPTTRLTLALANKSF